MRDLHVVERGTRSAGPVVVLVHGSMDRGAAMVGVSRLLEGCHVVWYDRRGYGRSLHEGAADLEGHVGDLLGIIDGRPSVVAGHSFGGIVGLTAAGRRPDLVRAVAAYEAPMPWREWWPSSTPGGGAVAAGGRDGAAAAAESFLRRMLGDDGWEMMPARAKDQRRLEGAALVAELASLGSRPAYDTAAISVPVVAGRGSQSPEHLRRAALELATETPLGELVEVDGAGHGAHRSHPEHFAALVTRAVDRAGAPGG